MCGMCDLKIVLWFSGPLSAGIRVAAARREAPVMARCNSLSDVGHRPRRQPVCWQKRGRPSTCEKNGVSRRVRAIGRRK